jgi:hypothetical protein
MSVLVCMYSIYVYLISVYVLNVCVCVCVCVCMYVCMYICKQICIYDIYIEACVVYLDRRKNSSHTLSLSLFHSLSPSLSLSLCVCACVSGIHPVITLRDSLNPKP